MLNIAINAEGGNENINHANNSRAPSSQGTNLKIFDMTSNNGGISGSRNSHQMQSQ
jgi:hypothetical protein